MLSLQHEVLRRESVEITGSFEKTVDLIYLTTFITNVITYTSPFFYPIDLLVRIGCARN